MSIFIPLISAAFYFGSSYSVHLKITSKLYKIASLALDEIEPWGGYLKDITKIA